MGANVSDSHVPPAGQVRLGRTMAFAGLSALVPLVGNAVVTLLTGWAGRVGWLLVPTVGVIVAMVTAAIEAYGSSAGARHPTKDAPQDLQRSAQRRPARGKTSLAAALILAVLVFGVGGLAVSEATRYVVIEARTTILESEPGTNARAPQATKPAPPASAPPPASARPKPTRPSSTPPSASARPKATRPAPTPPSARARARNPHLPLPHRLQSPRALARRLLLSCGLPLGSTAAGSACRDEAFNRANAS